MIIVEKQRIGNGKGYFIGGWVCAGVAGLVLFASEGGRDGGWILIEALLGLAAALFFVGFWIRLFGLLEARLIDIQRLIYNRTRLPENDGRAES